MKKKLSAKLLLLFLTTCMLNLHISSLAFAYDTEETTYNECEVIIEFDEDADTESVKKHIFEVLNGKFEIVAEYDTLIKGIAAKIPTYKLLAVECINGVKCVSDSLEYEALDTSSENNIKKQLNDLSPDLEYEGAGMLAAVLDSGFLTDDPYFTLSEGTELAKSKEDIEVIKAYYKISGVYVSDKIPYAYDYGENDTDVSSASLHGQHVAGIIGGNPKNAKDESKFSGVAPEVQLALMKIFSDETGTTKTSAILSALEDAILLGADVINLSFGSPCGNEEGRPMPASLKTAIDRAEELGAFIVCATGNVGGIGNGSVYDNGYGITYPLANNIDTGTVATPASINSAFSVGSLDETYKKRIYFYMGGEDGMRIGYTDTNMYYAIGNKRSFAALLGNELTAVYVGGDGTYEDYKHLNDLNGRLVIVRYRGEMSIENKMIFAKEAGAGGVIFYADKNEDARSLQLNLANAVIPAILVSYNDSVALRDNIGTELLFSDEYYHYELVEGSRKPADYSSGGISGDMSLNPDITASGTNILSLGAEELMNRSGSSMAAAYVSGAAILVKESLIKNKADSDVSNLKKIMMSSAFLLKDEVSGYEYSPRKQGAGMVDILSAVNSDLFISSVYGNGKIEIKNPLSYIFSFDIKIENTSNEVKDCYLALSVMTDELFVAEIPQKDGSTKSVYFNTERNVPLENSKVKINEEEANANKYAPDGERVKVSIQPNSSQTVKITVYMDAKTVSEKSKIFTSGFFVEGYIEAYDANGDVLASVPYVGFRGNRNNMSVFDPMIYDGESFFGKSYFYSYVYNSIAKLGSNSEVTDPYYSRDYISFSPNGDGIMDALYVSIGLLRNVESVKTEIIDSKGNVIYKYNNAGYTVKTHLDAKVLNNLSFMAWDGLKNDGTPYPDGKYTLVITAKSDRKNVEPERLEYVFTLDTAAPEMVGARLETDMKGKVYLVMEFKDEHHLQSLGYFSFIDGTGQRYEDSIHVSGDIVHGETTEFAVDVTFINSDAIYLTASDFAFNRTTYKYDMQYIYDNLS